MRLIVILALVAVVLATISATYARACESERFRLGGHRFTLLVKPSIWSTLPIIGSSMSGSAGAAQPTLQMLAR